MGFALFFILALLGTASLAQKDTGAIGGTVKDSSGALVVGAKVTIADVDRGTSLVINTNSQGEYVASPLKVGRYNVTVEKQGFKKASAGPITVNIQERPEVNVTVQVGSLNETVTVNTQGAQLETETSELGQVVNAQRAETLPLNGRNYAQLALLGVGVAPAEPGSRVSSSYGFSANGARSLQNNFLLDGVDNNANLGDVLNESAYVIQPSVDAIAEFKVQTNAYSAEFGRGNGAIMNAILKSGTNDLHGDVYEFLRNEKLDARNAFDQFGRQPYKQNQFGFTLGGPIVKNRTFFFGDYEGLRIRQATPTPAIIPTPAMIGGDFSSFLDLTTKAMAVDPNTGLASNNVALDCNGKPTFVGEIFDTRQTMTASNNLNGLCGVPIGGYDSAGNPTNVFPSGLIDPLAARLAALFPQPNANIAGNNFLSDPRRRESRNNFDIRIDHKIGVKDDSFGRFSYENQPSFIPPPFNNVLDGGGFFDGIEDDSYRSIALNETHLFRPTLVNEFRFGYNRINSHRFQLNFDKDISGQLGFPGVPFTPINGGLPSIGFSDGTVTIGSSTFLPSVERQNSFVFTDNLTWIHGRHSWKYGTELRFEQFTIFQPAESRGDMSFGTEFTDNPAAPTTGSGSFTGGAFATFLLGIPDGGDISSLHNIDYRRQIYSGYAEDDWKATDRLTLNLGLRYEVFSTIKEHNNELATFDFSSLSLIVPKGQNTPLTPTLATLLPIQRTASRGLIKPDRNNFAPRVGFAYRVTNHLVTRAGYGIFYGGQENGPFSNPSPGFNPPFYLQQTFQMTNCFDSSANPLQEDCSIPNFNVLSNGYPANSLSDPNNPSLYSLSPKLRTPYNQQWHFGLQYQLPAETVLEVSYAGSHGLKLYGFYNGNEAAPTPDTTAATAPRRPAHASLPGMGPCDLANSGNCNPVYDVSIPTFRSDDFSNYNSLQVRLQKRTSHGLEFEASYTYSHALDDASSANLGSQNQGDFRFQNNPRLEYGNADFDVRHRFVLSYAYELPFGKNHAIAGGASGAWNQVIGGWQVAGITTASTGQWFTPTDIATNLSNSDGGGTVFNAARPNVVGNPNGKHCASGTLFNTCAFVTNTISGSFGNAGRNIIRGPGFQNWDLSLFKTFPINENRRLEFRAEFFNAFNHVNPEFSNPNNIAENIATENGSPGFGFAQAARDPRFIQFALKFYF
ncbi:MAG: TonB-dependent receptor [Acidobacteria bacterium]|nr:MAG: TonB-dependent receptor [Acidobacteriota bacterium]PYV76331.1 MAG: TonB-dependent receptor [Acidobacteriota bacterium]